MVKARAEGVGEQVRVAAQHRLCLNRRVPSNPRKEFEPHRRERRTLK
jgi:hypothetical protein